MSKNLNFAVLVDGENVSSKKYRYILDEISKNGTIAIKWVYADFSDETYKCWENVIKSTASIPKHQYHISKDAVDHALMMDAIELICTNQRITAICIVSSDGGYAGIAQRIREKGLHMMAIGHEQTPETFRNACHDFVYIENLEQDENIENDHNNSKPLEALLLRAYWMEQDKSSVCLGKLGENLKKLDSTFDCRSHGARGLKKLIKTHSKTLELFDEQDDKCSVRLVKMQGKVDKTPNKDKDYAFLTVNETSHFFHREDLKSDDDWPKVKEGVWMQFVRVHDQGKNKPRATNVEIFENQARGN